MVRERVRPLPWVGKAQPSAGRQTIPGARQSAAAWLMIAGFFGTSRELWSKIASEEASWAGSVLSELRPRLWVH